MVTGDSTGESTSGGEAHQDRETMEILEGKRTSEINAPSLPDCPHQKILLIHVVFITTRITCRLKLNLKRL